MNLNDYLGLLVEVDGTTSISTILLVDVKTGSSSPFIYIYQPLGQSMRTIVRGAPVWESLHSKLDFSHSAIYVVSNILDFSHSAIYVVSNVSLRNSIQPSTFTTETICRRTSHDDPAVPSAPRPLKNHRHGKIKPL
jgi:hypothetical protein